MADLAINGEVWKKPEITADHLNRTAKWFASEIRKRKIQPDLTATFRASRSFALGCGVEEPEAIAFGRQVMALVAGKAEPVGRA